MEIRKLRVRGIDLKLERPVETAGGVMCSTPLVLLDLHTEEGITGSSYVRCYTPVALRALEQLTRAIGELLVGKSADPAAIEVQLQRQFRLLGPQGLTGIAMAGIDMALWDALAKERSVPLVELLGGNVDAQIPAYASLRTMSPAGAAQEAVELLERGFRAVKVKIGRAGLAEDLETIRAVRGAIGADADLMVDFNQSLSLAGALERVHVLDAEGLYWIEEPLRADDFAGHAKVAAAAQTPVQLGENWWGIADMEKSLAAHASDHVMLDVMKLGGVSAWLRAAALAQEANLPASSHTFPEFSSHLLAVTPTAHRLEYLDHAGPILIDPVRVVDGIVKIANRPGAGIEWNEDAIKTLSL